MRLAVLLCGVLSGVIALGFGWWGQADALLHVSGLADAVKVAVIVAIQPIALASIAGGAAILVFPSIARAALLASAVGWLGLVAILGGGLTLPVGILILLSAVGGLLGFLPSVREPMFRLQRAGAMDDEEPEQPRGRSAAPLRYDLRDAVSERATPPQQPVYQQPQPAPAYQQPVAPQAVAVQQPQPVQQPAPAPQPIALQPPIPLPQTVVQQPTAAPLQQPVPVQTGPVQQAVVPLQPGVLPEQQGPPRPRGLTFSSFDTMEGPAAALPQQVPPPHEPLTPPPPEPLPTLGGNVVPSGTGDANWQTYFPPPELATAVPTKPPEIKPAVFVPRYDLAEDHSQPFVPSPDDLRDVPVQPIPPPPPAAPPPDRDTRRRREQPPTYDFRRDQVPARNKEQPRRRSKAARRRAAVGIGALAIVIIGAPAFLVLDAQMRGGDAQALPATAVDASSSSKAPNQLGSSAPASASSEEVAEARLPKGAPLAPVDFDAEQASIASLNSNDQINTASSTPPATSSSNEFAALPPINALPSGPAVAPVDASTASSQVPVTTTTALPMAPKGPPYASPFDYCTALNNSDLPDASKITGGMPNSIANAARDNARMSDGEFHWRCMDKTLWVCVTPKGSPSCKPVPSAVDRVLFCASHPDVQVTNSPAGDWSCDGFTPVVSKAQLNAVDRRGFDRNVWEAFRPPQDPAPGAG